MELGPRGWPNHCLEAAILLLSQDPPISCSASSFYTLFPTFFLFLNPPFHHSCISFHLPKLPPSKQLTLIPFPHWSQNLLPPYPNFCFLCHFLGNYSLTCNYWYCYLDGGGLESQASLLTLQLYFFSIQCFLDRIFPPELWHPYLLLIKHR